MIFVVSIDLSEQLANQLDHPCFLEQLLSLTDGTVANYGRVLAIVDESYQLFEGVGDLAEEPEVHILPEEIIVLDFYEVGEFAQQLLGTQDMQ